MSRTIVLKFWKQSLICLELLHVQLLFYCCLLCIWLDCQVLKLWLYLIQNYCLKFWKQYLIHSELLYMQILFYCYLLCIWLNVYVIELWLYSVHPVVLNLWEQSWTLLVNVVSLHYWWHWLYNCCWSHYFVYILLFVVT